MMYNQREVLLVPFPFSDLFSFKRRPVLAVSNNTYNKGFPDLLVSVIASNLFKDDYSVTLTDEDLEVGILPETPVIKCHKSFTVDQSKILKRFSRAGESKFAEVIKVAYKLIEKTN